MTLIVETGQGIYDADSYVTRDYVDTYWANRPHDANATAWAASSNNNDNRDGCIREATLYLDAVYNVRYRGKRRSRVQGLEWPRTDAFDEDNYELPDLPSEIQKAVAELAVRAITTRLAIDYDRSGNLASEERKIGALSIKTNYVNWSGSSLRRKLGFVDELLTPILKTGGVGWAWR